MKKTRNSFFNSANFHSINNETGYQTSGNYFYQGPIPNNYNISTNTYESNIDSRLSKLERQINKLEYRISKLENNNIDITDDNINNSSNMYMI